MASVHKLSRDKGKKNKPYYIQYTDAGGKRVTIKGFTDKALTEQLASKLENEAMLRKRGIIDPTQEKQVAVRQSEIAEHLAAFERSLSNATPKHQKLTMTRVRRITDLCGFLTLGELDAEKAEECLKALRQAEDLGARTYNHYLQAVDEFGKWLAATKRLPVNPLAGIDRLNSETDVRHQRRALSPKEVASLVNSARGSGEIVQGYDGELRARAYLVSFFTGLRRQEIASLTPRSFRLDDDQPTVTVEAACSKHRRKDVLPLHPELVAMVREWIRGLEPDQLLFPRIERKKTWLMVKKDLERVGIPYETAEGIAEFHAAGRHSHITGLIRSGASIMEAKELARHADIRQTAKYTHIGMEDRAEALGNLPSPIISTSADCLHIVCISGVADRHEVSPDDSDDDGGGGGGNEQTPVLPGFVSPRVTNCHQLTACGKMEAAGIAPASRQASATASPCVPFISARSREIAIARAVPVHH
jgi:site-specific recombinase XerD